MQREQSVGVLRHTYLYSLKQWQMQQWHRGCQENRHTSLLHSLFWEVPGWYLRQESHPGELKDMVCSPAGTTIEGVRTLEKAGFRSAVFEALQACADKGKKM